MRYVVGGTFVLVGGLVIYGAVTGRLAAMVAAIAKPTDLVDGNLKNLAQHGGGIAGTGSTPDIPPPPGATGGTPKA